MSEPDDLLDEAFFEYLQARDQGKPVDVEELCRRYPGVAGQLRQDIRDDASPLLDSLPAQTLQCFKGPPEEAVPLGPFGAYELIEKIGAGAMGVVYRARKVLANREEALKVLRAGPLATPDDREDFLREARDVVALGGHANIVLIHDVGIHDNHPYFTMELAAGTLAGRVGELRGQPRQAAELMVQVASAIAFAHRSGILHRDLKPANVLLTEQGVPKVADFGLAQRLLVLEQPLSAKLQPGGLGLTHPNYDTVSFAPPAPGSRPTLAGTPSYMAPEQARGERRLTWAVDVYGLGAVLYELLTGQPPFRGADVRDVLRRVREEEPARPAKLNPSVGPDLEAICLKCLRKLPEERYRDAEAVAADLQCYLDGKPVEARPVAWPERLRRWARRQPLLASLGATIALLSLVLASVLVLQVVQYVERASAQQREFERQQWQLYLRGVWLADRHITYMQLALAQKGPLREHVASSALDLADDALRDCPEKHRDWEWHYLRRISARRAIRLVGHTLPVTGVCFSPPGARVPRVLTGAQDGTARLWSPSTGQQLAELRPHLGQVHACFSGDGTRAVTASMDQKAHVWDAETGRPLRTINDAGKLVACDRAGRWLIAVKPEQKVVRVYDQKTLEFLRDVKAPLVVVGLAISPDGNYLALNGYTEAPRVFEASSWREVVLKGPREANATAYALAFSPDGKHLAAGWAQPALYQLTGKDRPRFEAVGHFGSPGSQTPASLEFSPGGGLLAAPYRDGFVRVWEVATQRSVRAPHKHRTGVLGAAFSPDGDALAVTRGREVTIEALYTGKVNSVRKFSPPGKEPASPLAALSFSGDGALVAARDEHGAAHVWDVRSGEARKVPRLKKGRSVLLQDDQFLADSDGKLVSWAPGDGAPAQAGPCGAARFLVRADGRPLLAAATEAEEGRVLLINTRTRGRWSFSPGPTGANALAFHPDGARLVVGGKDGALSVRALGANEDAGAPLAFEGHRGTIHALAVSPDGRWLASAGDDRAIHLWDFETRELVRTLEGHGGIVQGLAFHPAGRRIASCGGDGAVKIWDLDHGAGLLTLADHGTPFTAIAFSPGGGLLAACDRAGAVHLWDGTPLADSASHSLSGEE